MSVLIAYPFLRTPPDSTGRIGRTTSNPGNSVRVGQLFQLSGSSMVSGAMLYLSNTGSNTEDSDIRIETDGASAPSGTLADPNATVTIPASAVPASYDWVTATFATPFLLNPNTNYWLVGKKTSEPGTIGQYYDWGGDASEDPHYQTKVLWIAVGFWVAGSSSTMYFQILGTALPTGSGTMKIQNVGIGNYIRSPKHGNQVMQVSIDNGNSFLCYPIKDSKASPVTLDTTSYTFVPIDTVVKKVTL